ncbi:MAG: hypothetical protein K2M91_05705 [Lachnospiraceae bacterium]|nr:hypothetical protein [Lachnospiraceae bacterium]
MLNESRKDSIEEVVDKLIKLDNIGMMIIMSNATALLARQELAESRTNWQRSIEEVE